MEVSVFVQTIVSGILIGGLYALIALGMTLIFGVMRIINLMHGELMMIGMYICFWLFNRYGIDPYISIIVSVPMLFFLGLFLQRFLISPVIKAKAPEENQILLTAGIGLVLTNIALMIFSPDYYTVLTSYSNANVIIKNISISLPMLWDFLIAIGITGLLTLFLLKTDLGSSIRATAQNYDSAIPWESTPTAS